MTSQEQRRAPGRPRSAAADRAILDAALSLYAERGSAEMTVDDIAERANVSKPTIYRRFASKDDLLVAAVESLYSDVEFVDSGDLRHDLVALVNQVQRSLFDSAVGEVIPRLLAEVAVGTRLGRAFQRRVLGPRLLSVRAAVDAAQRRGDVGADVDPELVVASVVGSMVFLRIFRGKRAALASAAESIVDQLLGGIT